MDEEEGGIGQEDKPIGREDSLGRYAAEGMNYEPKTGQRAKANGCWMLGWLMDKQVMALQRYNESGSHQRSIDFDSISGGVARGQGLAEDSSLSLELQGKAHQETRL